jgi:hypothetical protein
MRAPVPHAPRPRRFWGLLSAATLAAVTLLPAAPASATLLTPEGKPFDSIAYCYSPGGAMTIQAKPSPGNAALVITLSRVGNPDEAYQYEPVLPVANASGVAVYEFTGLPSGSWNVHVQYWWQIRPPSEGQEAEYLQNGEWVTAIVGNSGPEATCEL